MTKQELAELKRRAASESVSPQDVSLLIDTAEQQGWHIEKMEEYLRRECDISAEARLQVDAFRALVTELRRRVEELEGKK